MAGPREIPGVMGGLLSAPGHLIRSVASLGKHSRRLRPVYNIISGEEQTEILRPKSRFCSRLPTCNCEGLSSWRKVWGHFCLDAAAISQTVSIESACLLGCTPKVCLTLPVQVAGAATVTHVTIVIFLEFFAWGLVATILPEVSRACVRACVCM